MGNYWSISQSHMTDTPNITDAHCHNNSINDPGIQGPYMCYVLVAFTRAMRLCISKACQVVYLSIPT